MLNEVGLAHAGGWKSKSCCLVKGFIAKMCLKDSTMGREGDFVDCKDLWISN